MERLLAGYDEARHACAGDELRTPNWRMILNSSHTRSQKYPSGRQFPPSFWAANIMEIFERMGWYGFYAVSSLYLTGAVADGGLGLSSEDRGVIQGLATFFLYLFPAVFGALADRYGFKRMFLASCLVMIPGYLLLGIPNGFWGFLAVYFLVAVGHGMFKPVVIRTVAKSHQREDRQHGLRHLLHDGQHRRLPGPDRGRHRARLGLAVRLLLPRPAGSC